MDRETTIFGIDPGQNGGIACINKYWVEVIPMPLAGKAINAGEIATWLQRHSTMNAVAYIEKVHSMPKQGVASSFKFGLNTGVIHGVLGALRIPMRLVTPQAWKKVILAGTNKDKKAAIDFCMMAYPKTSLLATEKSRVPHSGMADAICIAEYGERMMNNVK